MKKKTLIKPVIFYWCTK